MVAMSVHVVPSNMLGSRGPGAVVKAACLVSRGWRVKPHAGLQVSKKQNVSSPLTRNDLILCGVSVAERKRARPQTARARISNPVSEGQCHLTILRRFSWPSLAYMCPNVA